MSNLNLTKGEKVDLTKGRPTLKILNVGLGWDVNKGTGNGEFDLDASAILLDAAKKVVTDGVIFFNHKVGHGLTHGGDNLTGAGDGDDETIAIELDKVPAEVEKIIIIVNIYEADDRKQHFGQVRNAFVRAYDASTNEELVKYDLSEDYSGKTGMIMAQIYRHNGEWKFEAMGNGANGDINQIVAAIQNLL